MKWFYVLVCLMLMGCSRSNHQEAVYIKYVDNIVNNNKRQALCENLRLCGSGGRLFSDVDRIIVGYQSRRPATVDEARDQFVWLATDLINRMNTHPDIQPYLHNVPSTIENIKLSIYYPFDPSQPDQIEWVSNYDSQIGYFRSYSTPPATLLHKESFDEAVSRANQ